MLKVDCNSIFENSNQRSFYFPTSSKYLLSRKVGAEISNTVIIGNILQNWIKLQNLVQNETSTLLKKSSPWLKLCINLKKEILLSHTGFVLIKRIEKIKINKRENNPKTA